MYMQEKVNEMWCMLERGQKVFLGIVIGKVQQKCSLLPIVRLRINNMQ